MKGRKVIGIIASCVLLTVALFVGCSNENREEEKVEKPQIGSGAIIAEGNGDFKNLNLINNKYTILENFKGITNYSKDSGNYIYLENGNYYATNGVEKVEILGNSLSKVELSKNGEYVSYFSVDEGYKFEVINISKNEKKEIKSNVSISGDLIEWINGEEIAYYGISEDGVNGLFCYNFKTKEEKTLYKIESGFVEKLLSCNDGIYFIQNNFGESKSISFLNKEKEIKEVYGAKKGVINNFIKRDDEVYFTLKEAGKSAVLNVIDKNGNSKKLVEGIVELKDIIKISDKYVILGTFEGDHESIYFIENGKAGRVVYGFPAVVMGERALLKNEDKVLFVGKDGEDSQEEGVYSIDEKKNITSIYRGKGQIEFIKMH
ncbi:MAG: hypothetical protein ACRC2K_03135 [Clostridium sp.]